MKVQPFKAHFMGVALVVTSMVAGILFMAGLEGYKQSEASTRVNLAAAANGGKAEASSHYANDPAKYPASAVINGDRTGKNNGAGGTWADGTANTWPDWVSVTLPQARTISEVDVFSVQDSWKAPATPTESLTGSQWVLRDFEVQYWNGTDWVMIPGAKVTGNTKIWNKFIFHSLKTSKVRVLVSKGDIGGNAQIAEVEIYESYQADGPVISSFTASPTTITKGGSSTLSWNVTGATSVVLAENGISGPPSSALAGTAAVSPASTTTYTLTASNGTTSASKSVTVTVTSATVPAVFFSSNTTSVAAGQPATLSWNVAGASSVAIDQGIGVVAASGSKAVTPATTTTYTLTATGTGGTITKAITITVQKNSLPVIQSFTAEPATVQRGESTRLSWTLIGGTSMVLSENGNAGPPSPASNLSTSTTPQVTTTFTLTVSNSSGSTSKSVTVNVVQPSVPELTLTLSQDTADPGQPVTLSWNAKNATAVSLNQGIGTVAASGSKTVSAHMPTVYRLAAVNALGTSTKAVTLRVNNTKPVVPMGKMAYVLLLKPGTAANPADLAILEEKKKVFAAAFSEATYGRASIDTNTPTVVMTIPESLMPGFEAGEINDRMLLKEYFKANLDSYEFLEIYPAFTVPLVGNVVAYHPTVINKVKGTGMGIWDLSEDYGSSRTLQGYTIFARLGDAEPTALLELHELGHQWCCFAGDQHGSGGRLEIRDSAHYYPGLNSDNRDPLGGRNWVEYPDGTIKEEPVSPAGTVHYHPFTLYFMGLLDPGAYDADFSLYKLETGMPERYKTIDINQIIAAEGPRTIVNPARIDWVAPAGHGERLGLGSKYTIKWSTTDMPAGTLMDIAISTKVSGPDGVAYVATGLPNTGSYEWDTSKPLVPFNPGGLSVISAGEYSLAIIPRAPSAYLVSSISRDISFSASVKNIALASNGGQATASSYYLNDPAKYPASAVINGDRTGKNNGAGGTWGDGTANAWPDSVEVTLPKVGPVTEVHVFGIQDNWKSPVEPTESMTGTLWVPKDFKIEYWNGTAWQAIPGASVIDNTKVWVRFAFPAINTDKVRVVISRGSGGGSQIAEIEVY